MKISQMKQRFREADPKFGPVPFWWWSAETVTEERIKWQMKKFRQGGLRNIGIINIAPTGPQYGSVPDQPTYFSEEWWRMFEVALRESERLGMTLFFYDQIGFSGSNFPARIVAEHPEYTGYILKRYKDKEQIPEGSQYLTFKDEYHYVAARQGFNWLDAEACAMLLDRVHGEFERRFPADLGKTLGGTFQDELPPLNLWTGHMADLYKERYGECVLSQLPALFDDVPNAREVRQRMYELATELAEESFFKPIAAWHERYDMLLCCDQAGPARKVEVHGAQRLYLDYMRTHRWYNASGSDMDGEIKPHASMVHLNGGKRVFLEAFHTSGWGGTLEETMHWLIPWFQAGVTLYSSHSVYFSTRGGWWEWAPPDTGWRQPYFEHYSIFADTVSRACSLLSEGAHVADIAVHYPSYAANGQMSLSDGKENEHPMAVANRMPNDKLKHIQDVYDRITGKWGRRNQEQLGLLRSLNYDYDIVDDSALEKARIQTGQLCIANEKFSLLILCGTLEMDQAAREKVETWLTQGGKVIAVEVPQEEQQPWPGVEYCSSLEEAGAYIERHIAKRVIGDGMAMMRTTDEADIFLLLPKQGELLRSHEPANVGRALQEETVYRIRSKGTPQQWDPVTGLVSEIPYEREGEWLTVQVSLASWPAGFIVCVFDEAAYAPLLDNGESELNNNSNASCFPASVRSLPSNSKEKSITADAWQVQVKPTLDNTYGDFDLHGELTDHLAVERRQFQVKLESEQADGMAAGWHLPEYDDGDWNTRLWTEATYWHASKGAAFDSASCWPVVYSQTLGDMKFRTWAGRMGRVPRRFVNLGTYSKGELVSAQSYVIAPRAGRYWMRLESNAVIKGWVNGSELQWHGGPEEQTTWVTLEEGANLVTMQAQALVTGIVRFGIEFNEIERESLPKWIYAQEPHLKTELVNEINSEHASNSAITKVSIVFAGRGRGILTVNGTKVTEHGDFNPYIRQGQELVDVTDIWLAGRNVVKFLLPEGSGEVFCDGAIEYEDGTKQLFCTGEDWKDEQGKPVLILHEAVLQFAETETLWLSARPHPLADVGWLLPEAVPEPKPLAFHPQPAWLGKPIWLRFPVPVGSIAIDVKCKGKFQAWLAGESLQVVGTRAEFPAQVAGTLISLRIVPDGAYSDADVLTEPVRFETAQATGALGDWRTALSLPHYSGAVEYETAFESQTADQHQMLDLGHVRGTAEVWIDEDPVGVRLWRPYRYDLGKLNKGMHKVRIRVTNTLGTHYEVGRPSHNVGGSLDPKVSYWAKEGSIAQDWQQQFAAGGLYGPVQLFEINK